MRKEDGYIDIENNEEKKVIKEVRDKIEREKSLKTSIKEGSASSVMTGFGDSYITPYALTLNANNAQIGFLTSFTNLFAPIAQLFGSKLMEKYSRKSIVSKFVFIQALTWILMISLGFLFFKNIIPGLIPIALIIIYVSYAIIGAIPGPSWFSWMGDIVPESMRGKYFSKRNLICGIIALIAMLVGAFILDIFATRGYVLLGFSLLFFLAMVGRLFSAYYFTKQYEPKLELRKGYYFSFFSFIRNSLNNNFGRFTIFVALIHFGTNIAGPFFAVYMLKELEFNYTTYMLVNISATVFSLLIMPYIGKVADKFGNRELLRFGGLLIPVMPFLWLFSPNPYYLAFVPQLVGGIGWAAFNLGVSNYIYDNVTPERRGICVSYFNIFAGVGIFLGASIGGLIAEYAPVKLISIFFFLFILSGLTRGIVSIIFLPRLNENRKVQKGSLLQVFKEIVPMRGIVYNLCGLVKHN